MTEYKKLYGWYYLRDRGIIAFVENDTDRDSVVTGLVGEKVKIAGKVFEVLKVYTYGGTGTILQGDTMGLLVNVREFAQARFRGNKPYRTSSNSRKTRNLKTKTNQYEYPKRTYGVPAGA